jgi:hypothetical protein
MIGVYERYHGTVLRELIVRAPGPVLVEKWDEGGRVDTYVLNQHTGLWIKHSAKRLPPWQFTFTRENLSELDNLISAHPSSWLALVCGIDGIVALSVTEFRTLTDVTGRAARFIRVDRDRKTRYRVFGNAGRLQSAKARGIAAVISDAFRTS